MRILLGHGFRPQAINGEKWIENWLFRLRSAGFDVHALRLDLPVPGGRLKWPELDRRWQRGDRQLLSLYERVADACSRCDVLVNYGGLNLHPDFLAVLPATSVLAFFDDPESSEDCSHYVAGAHDLCLVGNVAEVETYTSWGVRNAQWWPMGFRADDHDPKVSEQELMGSERDVDVALICERKTHFRRRNVDCLAAAFPQGVFRGPGWPEGVLPEAERIRLLQRTKIGFNMHNSTGPINLRTFYLPANGVLEICDNAQHLSKVFDVGKEVVGYNTVDEAIDLGRYYLSHENERLDIAVAGYRRVLRDYNEVAVFRRLVDAVKPLLVSTRSGEPVVTQQFLSLHRKRTVLKRAAYYGGLPITKPWRLGERVVVGIHRRMMRVRDDWRLIARRRRKRH